MLNPFSLILPALLSGTNSKKVYGPPKPANLKGKRRKPIDCPVCQGKAIKTGELVNTDRVYTCQNNHRFTWEGTVEK